MLTKLDRFARSLPDASVIAEGLPAWSMKLNLGRSVCDPTDPFGRLLSMAMGKSSLMARCRSSLVAR